MFGKGAPRCRRCGDAVYAAEEIIGASQKWHVQCFSCKNCKVRLSSTTLTEKDGEIFCAPCYAKNFGPKGFGIGGSLVTTGVSVSDHGKPASSPVSSSSSYSAASPSNSSAGAKYCCGKKTEGRFCGECGKPAQAAVATAPAPAPAAASSAPVYSPPAATGAVRSWQGISRPAPASFAPTGDRCGKCNERVYDAERVNGGGKVWHSACFRCTTCRTGLSSTTLNDKDGQIYCGACYAKQYGPKGFGFSGGAATTFASTR